MKIALVHYAYPPVVGGVERVIEEHVRLFRSHGHEVTVVCQRGGDGEGALVIPLHGSAAELATALRETLTGMDVVFIHNVMTMPFHEGLTLALGALASELSHVRFVAWVHDVATLNPDLRSPDWVRKAYPRLQYVAVSDLRRRQWLAVSGCESRVIPNGVDPARILGLPPALAEFAERHTLLDGRLLLLHPTRLLRRKNVEASLAIVSAVQKSGRPATLLVTGAEDPHNPASAQYARWLAVEQGRLGAHAWFLSEHFEVGDAELSGLYRMADALLFPSRQEGFGLPLLEAALHRLPVFCSNVEPLPEVAGESACLFDPDEDPGEVAERLLGSLHGDGAAVGKRRILQNYAWEALYCRHLAPLLQGL